MPWAHWPDDDDDDDDDDDGDADGDDDDKAERRCPDHIGPTMMMMTMMMMLMLMESVGALVSAVLT